MSSAIWWIRRDLRLSDNHALAAALQRADVVIPVFILDPFLLASPYTGVKRLAFLFDGLRQVDFSLRQLGSALILRQGEPLEVLQVLLAETGADRIFAEADITPYARRRDKRVEAQLPLSLIHGVTLYPPEILLKPDGAPYTIYTPFNRLWRSLPFPGSPIPAPPRLPAMPPLFNYGIPAEHSLSSKASFQAGETEAQRRLAAFADSSITCYAEQRNRLDLDGTSGLSPYLRFGMISARQAVWAAKQVELQAQDASARRSVETWQDELIWREFYATILYYFPHVRYTAFHPKLRRIPWRNDPASFTAWCEGRTGYPVVDAAMRQLNSIGWMHNRGRMLVASFLTKDLLIDWQLGERYFMLQLLDGDPASNNGGWQWTAGTGSDAAPYFRVFNPILQGMKFDPKGMYVRRWLPELTSVPDSYIHIPWKMPDELQRRVGCLIGKDYPAPIVDHAIVRQRALDAYRSAENII